MKQKNKTTHKHNFKLVEIKPFIDELTGMEFNFEVYNCLCGAGSLRLKHKYQFIFIPDNATN